MIIKAIAFDIDGTLLNTKLLVERSRLNAIKAMIEAGLHISDVSEAYMKLLNIIQKYGPNYNHHFERFLEELSVEVNPKLIAAAIVAYHDTKRAYLKPDPDVLPTLIKLKTFGIKLAIISNGLSVKQWEKLIRLGIHHFFDTVIISEEVGVEKPNQKIFQTALEKMRLKPNEMIYIGDNIETDIIGANSVGIISVKLDREDSRDEETRKHIKKPRYTIHKFKEIYSLCQKLVY
ncbi:MAG: TIGR02253 family HAD-type hydrolase [Candidatus Hodarchaeales archaeon]|jgi:putative hydrolase of the HAD superfamily